MKIVRIIGGLGNQMFQYAFFLSLKEKNNKVKIDISDFNNYMLHNGIELSKIFTIDLSNHSIQKNRIPFKDYYSAFKFRKFLGILFFYNKNLFIKKTHFIEKNYSAFNESLFFSNNIYLDGYWQNQEYFLKIKDIIIKEFNWKIVSPKNKIVAKSMSNENSVSLHIRRMDKVKNIKQLLYRIKLLLVWRVSNKKYYLDAINFIQDKVENPKFYIFTDNIEWVKNNIKMNDDNYTIVDWNRGEESNQDMYLMTQCKHNVISMSTFSWWGAWLNNNKNKIVVSPKKWAFRLEKDNGIIPKNWVRI